MADGRERVWKLNEYGFRCLILREEHREMFLLRRKELTYKAIGDLYQVSPNHARQLVERHMRIRRARVSRYLKDRNNRGGPMTDNLLKRLREFDGWDVYGRPNFVICDEAADRIEMLEAALKKIAQHDMQAIAIDALRPSKRIRGTDD